MKTRIGARRWATALLALPLLAIIAAVAPGSASAGPDGGGGNRDQRDHWGVIARNTIGSPVAELRNGPFTRFNPTGTLVRPPYGQGSLGIEVADDSTTLSPSSEKVDFGNEVDFFGKPVADLTRVGFHVFQTGENITYGGTTVNMPNIRFEINPNLAANTTTYSSLVWVPDESPTVNGWSPFLDATLTGKWFLTGAAGTVTGCNQTTLCTFAAVQTALADGGAAATIYTAAVGKGRDFIWVGAVDGLRINDTIYDFEESGVRTIRPRPGA